MKHSQAGKSAFPVLTPRIAPLWGAGDAAHPRHSAGSDPAGRGLPQLGARHPPGPAHPAHSTRPSASPAAERFTDRGCRSPALCEEPRWHFTKAFIFARFCLRYFHRLRRCHPTARAPPALPHRGWERTRGTQGKEASCHVPARCHIPSAQLQRAGGKQQGQILTWPEHLSRAGGFGQGTALCPAPTGTSSGGEDQRREAA